MLERGLAKRGLAMVTLERSCLEILDPTAFVNEPRLQGQGKKGLEFGYQARGP